MYSECFIFLCTETSAYSYLYRIKSGNFIFGKYNGTLKCEPHARRFI